MITWPAQMVENLITRLVTAPGGIVGQNIDSCITIHYPHSVQHQNQVQETVAGYHYVGAEAPHSSIRTTYIHAKNILNYKTL